MSLETEILEGQNFALPNQEVIAETAQGQNAPSARKLYDLQDTTSRYMEDRFLLIAKINKLENKQLRGIVPIVKSQNTANGADDKKNDDNQKLEFDLYELSDQKCKELHNYIENCLQINEENKFKEENQRKMDEQMRLMIEQQRQVNGYQQMGINNIAKGNANEILPQLFEDQMGEVLNQNGMDMQMQLVSGAQNAVMGA